jgi:hypothetical protein
VRLVAHAGILPQVMQRCVRTYLGSLTLFLKNNSTR